MTMTTIQITTIYIFTFTSLQFLEIKNKFESQLLSILQFFFAASERCWCGFTNVVGFVVLQIIVRGQRQKREKNECLKCKSINHYCNSALTPTQHRYPAGFLQASVQQLLHLWFHFDLNCNTKIYRPLYLSTLVFVCLQG